MLGPVEIGKRSVTMSKRCLKTQIATEDKNKNILL